MGRDDEPKSLSIRRSIVVWVVGAVLLWGLTVAVLYSAVRYVGSSEEPPSTKASPSAITVKDPRKEVPATGGEKNQTPPEDDQAEP